MTTFDLVDRIMAYEQGDSTDLENLELFAHLIRTGQAWTLQGHYGRAAAQLIKQGAILRDGTITEEGRSWSDH